MFDPILNYTADVYEAIIAAFIVVGLLQSFALRRKWNQAEKLKSNLTKVATAATGAILSLMVKSVAEVASARRAQKRAEAERDDAIAVAEHATTLAEERTQDAINARADADDAADELRATRPNTGGLDRATPDLAALLGLVGSNRRPNGAELLDSIFGERVNPFNRIRTRTTFPGYDASGGTFNREPGAPDVPFSFEDLQKAIGGDASDLERAIGAVPGSTILEVVGPEGPITDPVERRRILDEFLRTDGILAGARRSAQFHPALGAGYGSNGEEALKAALAEDASVHEEAARHFGPDSGAVNPDAEHPADAEACDTQRAPERSVPRFAADDGKANGAERPGFHGGARSGPLGFDG